MAENTYSISEIVGSSKVGIDDAIRGAIERASKTLHNLDWFEVVISEGAHGVKSAGRVFVRLGCGPEGRGVHGRAR